MELSFETQMAAAAESLSVAVAIDPRTFELLGVHAQDVEALRDYLEALRATEEDLIREDAEDGISFILLIRDYIKIVERAIDYYPSNRSN